MTSSPVPAMYRDASDRLIIDAGSGRDTRITAPAKVGTSLIVTLASLLGTVSQSAGVPTGALFETGSNADGTYVRFANGVQICWAAVSVTPVAATPTAAAFDWPIAFSETPAAFTNPISGTLGGVLKGFTISARSTTGYSITILRDNTTLTNGDVIAVGRWF